ncbi:MAG: hypothetical protein IH597_08765 [Bacteroidales bacterium]|nr:hypothetical protein [Bacteroidales bacterium]
MLPVLKLYRISKHPYYGDFIQQKSLYFNTDFIECLIQVNDISIKELLMVLIVSDDNHVGGR